MEPIRIKIKQLGRVRDSEIVLKPFMLLSGESGLGKSYVAFLCHYIYMVLADSKSTRINHFFEDNGYDYAELSKNYKNEGIALSFPKSELEDWLSKDAVRFVGYMVGNPDLKGDVRIMLPNTVEDTIKFTYKEEIAGLVGHDDVYILLSYNNISVRSLSDTQPDFAASPFAVLLMYGLLTAVFGFPLSISTSVIFPPSRGSLLTEDIHPEQVKTGMYIEYLKAIDSFKKSKPMPEKVDKSLAALLNTILGGNLAQEDTGYYYITENGEKMPLSAAASSIRELAPLRLLANRTNMSACELMYEEPEAHLHPEKQRLMGDVLAALRRCGTRLIVTTHSDYLLKRLNEIILFLNVKENKKNWQQLEEKLNIHSGMYFNVKDVAAYLLKGNEDGSSKVVLQNTKEGIPFTTFLNANKANVEYHDYLMEAMGDELEQ